MKKKIGFKVTDNKLATIEERFFNVTREETAQAILEREARAKAIDVALMAIDGYKFPGYNGEDRALFFGKKLMKIKERYLDKI